MDEIRWEDPPPPSDWRGNAPRGSKYDAIRKEMIANPGCWVVLREVDSDRDAGLRSYMKTIKASRDLWAGYRWETTSRRGEKTTKLYVRCLGPLDDAS